MRGIAFTFAVLLLAGPAVGEPSEPEACTAARRLEQEIREAGARIEEVMAEAKPICAKKRESQAMADECARLRLYLEDAMRALKELEAQRRAAAKACKS